MRNTLRSVVALAIIAFLAVGPAAAELPFTGYRAVGPIAGTSSTASADNAAIYVRYIGSGAGKPTVAVDAATGDLTFQLAGVAVDEFECPVSGALGGVIDVSNASCNTFAEVVNTINASASWRAVIVDALGTDASTDSLAALSATDTNIRTSGVPLYYDTNYAGSAPTVTVAVRPPGGDGSFFFAGPSGGLNPNPFGNLTSFLSGVSEKKTSAGTIAATVIYAVKRVYQGTSRTLSESIRTVWSQTGGATATQATLDFSNFPLVSAPGEMFVVRIGSSTTISVQNLNAVGVFAQKQ